MSSESSKPDSQKPDSQKSPIASRRSLLQNGARIAGVALAAQAVVAQSPDQFGAPAVVRGAQAGRRFKGFVRTGNQYSVEDLRLLDIHPRQMVIRTEASAPCYTMVIRGLGGTPSMPGAPAFGGAPAAANAPTPVPTIENHCSVGIVEAVGSDVRRAKPGDRVLIGVTSQCGQCYHCLRGRADWCQFTFGISTFPPIAERLDGTKVNNALGIGGLSDLNVVWEEYTCPVFTNLPAAQLALLGDTVASGFAAGMCLMQIEPGSDVAVLGAGALGLGAVQAARVMGASQIIAIEPVRHRRELALKLGATAVLDPAAEGEGLVEKVREMCKGTTDNYFAGGRTWSKTRGADNRGADFTIEAVGRTGDLPKVEPPPDPSGIKPMQQAWDLTRTGGSLVYLGFGQAGNVSFPASQFANRGRNVFSGQQGGLNMMRDLPRFVRLAEEGKLDLKSMVTSTWPLEKTRDALQVLSDRTEMCPVVVFS
jgi:S-(hydroxymethyl)glutathione dehydrogenase / alcohol dehydrogenase